MMVEPPQISQIPQLYFHVSYSFHKWFLYHKGDFSPEFLDGLKEKVVQFEKLWAVHEKEILTLIPRYTGIGWPFSEIHVYCFENAEYYPVPCIADPVSINITGDDLHLFLLYLVHELVHVIIQFDDRFNHVSLDTQETIAYFVGNRVCEDVLKEKAHRVIELFTVQWPYNFSRIAEEFKGKINVDENTVRELIEKGLNTES